MPDNGNPFTYEDYINAPGTEEQVLVPSSHAVDRPRSLKRGVRSGANILLDWMVILDLPRSSKSLTSIQEQSAFPILSRKLLHSIVFRILENPQESDNILEEHIINIEYPHASNGQDLGVASIQKSIKDAASRLVQYGQVLPKLPHKKYITMVLQHSLPHHELPKDFRTITLNHTAFPEVSGFQVSSNETLLISTGYQEYIQLSIYIVV